MSSNTPSELLADLTVVELAEHVAVPYAARLFADLGASVVKLEPPEGDPTRRSGPFPDERRSVDESGLFHALNAGKRSLVVDPDRVDARDIVDAAIGSADVLLVGAGSRLEPLVRGRLEELGERFPHLVIGRLASTPDGFGYPTAVDGSIGPAALSGASQLIGEPDRPPLPPPSDLLDYLTGATFAAAALLATLVRDETGHGQTVTLYESELLVSILHSGTLVIPPGVDYARSGRRFPGSGGPYPFGIFPCKDGQVAFVGRSKQNWMSIKKMMGDPPWSMDARFEEPLEIAFHYADEVDALLIPLMEQYTRDELLEFGRREAVAVGPVLTIAEVISHEQFTGSGIFSDTISVGGKEFRYAKRPYKFSKTPVASASAPAPTLGVPVTGPVPIDRPGSDGVRRVVEPRPVRRQGGSGPLAGLRVIDFSWAWSGPSVAATFADFGAEVIKVEHRSRLDNARNRARPIRDGVPLEGPIEEVSLYFHQNNRGKLSAGIDLKDPVGRDLVQQLIASADVVIENLSLGVFERAGLGYDVVSRDNPALVWLSLSAVGRTGPLAAARGYAPIMTSLAGIESLVGYEGERPIGCLGIGYGDPSGAAHGLVAVLAALRHARHTGEGQYIDTSQTEAAIAALTAPIAEYLFTGEVPLPRGMRHASHLPHGNYPCEGNDAWVAIWVTDDEEWARLVALAGHAGLLGSVGADAARDERAICRPEIDVALSAWTSTRDRDEAVNALRSSDVHAVPVLSFGEATAAWEAYDTFSTVQHRMTGPERVAQVPWRMSRTPRIDVDAAPLVGQHTDDVVSRILGLDAGTREKLFEAGTLEGPVEPLESR